MAEEAGQAGAGDVRQAVAGFKGDGLRGSTSSSAPTSLAWRVARPTGRLLGSQNAGLVAGAVAAPARITPNRRRARPHA